MENQKQTLPSNIDTEVLELINSFSTQLNAIAKGWKMLVQELKSKETKEETQEPIVTEEN